MHEILQEEHNKIQFKIESKVTYLSTADLRSCNWLMMNKMQRISVDFFDVIVR